MSRNDSLSISLCLVLAGFGSAGRCVLMTRLEKPSVTAKRKPRMRTAHPKPTRDWRVRKRMGMAML